MKRLSSLRYRLLSLVLIPLVLLSGSVMVLAYRWSSNYTYEQLFAKVNTDLRVARDRFSDIEANGQRQLLALANSVQLANALALGDTSRIDELISSESELGNFDFLNLISGSGQEIISVDGWKPYDFRQSSLKEQVLSARVPTVVSGIEIYTAQQWQRQRGLDQTMVALPLLDTARAAPTDRRSEDRAMIIRTLCSLYDASGSRVAILEAGLLLNRNFDFVDQIRDLVYGPGSLAPGSRGTVTVFLDDVRITTNVVMTDNTRALGTRVSSEVRDAVLNRGETWVDRAFVVNDWFISAYEPIVDSDDRRVGMLYAGYLEAPFRAQLFKAITALSLLVLAGSLAAAGAAILGARSIFAPIENITSVVRATARGEHKRIGPVSTGNEIGELASQFDAMLDNIDRHRQRIEQDAQVLEEKVRERTVELERQNERLQESITLLKQTRQQLANAEKLAALGELTAGVAHEINNPTAVILGNMDVLVAELGDRKGEMKTEIDLIIKQVYRIRSITDRLLQYSRSVHEFEDNRREAASLPAPFNQSAPIDQLLQEQERVSVRPVVIRKVLQDTLTLLSHELRGRNIRVNVSGKPVLGALIDREEFQQVLINLISNAIQAIVKDGEIDIDACDSGDSHIRLSVEDTGCGIEPDHLPRVFDPFFTAGKLQGTGLGLSVSYGIVRRHRGDISVVSALGCGSKFTLTLPAA